MKYEEISDRIEYEIIGELESLGDSGESISRILSRRNIHNKTFDGDTIKKLNAMVDFMINISQVLLKYVARK